MPALNNNGIVVLQPTTFIEGKNFIKTVLLHESGETIEALTEIVYSKQNDAQSQGSGITYARRYGLQSLVNVGAEDDDGNSASTKDVKVSVNVDDYINKLNACTTKDALRAVYLSMPKSIQTQLVEYVKTLSESKA